MKKERGLQAVPDPVAEENDDETAEQPKGYTLADQVKRNTQLIRELADEFDIDPAAVVTIFATTMNIHFTKIQLGLAAPVEG